MEKEYLEVVEMLGKNVQSRRKKLGISQLDLELRTGINRGDISKIENGLKNIELMTVVKLATALEVEVHELFIPSNR